MKPISIIGPTNLADLSHLLQLSEIDIEETCNKIGKLLAFRYSILTVVFNYAGVLSIVGDSFKKYGGKLEMLYTHNDYDWRIEPYIANLEFADTTVACDSWHDMLLKLVSKNQHIVCCGLSLGVLCELAYIKWNKQDNMGTLKSIFFVSELLREGKLLPEIEITLHDLYEIINLKDMSVDTL